MAGPEEQKKGSIQNIKIYFENMPAKRRRLVLFAVLGLVLVAAGLTLFLNTRSSGYVVLYEGLSSAETVEVHDAVQELGVTPRLDERSRILVPAERYDYLLIQLAARGYPKSTLSYTIFLDNAGMTATESDKKEYRIFELQDRIQATLARIEGVESAVVTLNIPDTTDNVWAIANPDQPPASAGVLLTLGRDVELIPEQVGAIQHLIAASVPQMEAVNVKVIDAATGLPLEGLDGATGGVSGGRSRLALEETFQRVIENNVRRILIPWYGDEGVFVVARVTLDLNKMMSERMELIERLGPAGENLGGYTTHREVEGVVEGADNVSGLVGEENNTDIPNYLLEGEAAGQNYEHYWGAADFDYGYLKTQIESGNAEIERGTVSVIVDENSLTEARRAELIDIISKSADILPEFIALSALNPPPAVPDDIVVEPEPEPEPVTLPLWALIAIGAAVALILILILVFILLRRRAARLAREREEELVAQQADMVSEIERYKQELADAAMASVNAKDDAITGEIRQFARDNPEITANLLRNWLKEGEEG